MLSKEQTEEVKKQILQQIDTTFPEDKKDSAKKKIESLTSEELEEFLKQNNLVQDSTTPQENPFRLIVENKIPSYKIGENPEAIAVLEINPISNGHTIIIPKKALEKKEEIGKDLKIFSQTIAKKLKDKLGPKDVQIESSHIFGETIINLIPVYVNETINSKRNQTKPEELKILQKILEEKPIKEPIKKPKIEKLDSKKIRLPKRIP